MAPLLIAAALAQPAPPEPEQAPAPPAMEPAAPGALNESRGLLEAIGRLFGQGSAGFRSHVEGARSSFGDFNDRAAVTTKNLGNTAVEVGRNAVEAGVAAADVTRDAVGTVAKLPLSRVVSGRERCAIAANGAPDCQAAADAMCRKQGYASGKSMEFTSAEQCSPRVLLSGRQSDNDCATVTFISRAVCQ
jgi:hypothetical protein